MAQGSDPESPRLTVAERAPNERLPAVWALWRPAGGSVRPESGVWAAPDPLLWLALLRLDPGVTYEPLLGLFGAGLPPRESEFAGSAHLKLLLARQISPNWRAEMVRALSRPEFLAALREPCPDSGPAAAQPLGDDLSGWNLAPLHVGDWELTGCTNAAGVNLWISNPADLARAERPEVGGSDDRSEDSPEARLAASLPNPLHDWLYIQGWGLADGDSWPLSNAEDTSPDRAPVTEGASAAEVARVGNGGDYTLLELEAPDQPPGAPNRDLALWVHRGAIMTTEFSAPDTFGDADWKLVRELALRTEGDPDLIEAALRAQIDRPCPGGSVEGLETELVGGAMAGACAEPTSAGPRHTVRVNLVPGLVSPARSAGMLRPFAGAADQRPRRYAFDPAVLWREDARWQAQRAREELVAPLR